MVLTHTTGQGIDALDQEQVLKLVDGSYVVRGVTNELEVTLNSGTLGQGDTLQVDTGDAVVEGTTHSFGSTTNVQIDAADPTNPRKDVVYVASGGSISVAKGSPNAAQPSGNSRRDAYTPAPADLSATAAAPLAEVWVPAGSSSIVSGDISDRRLLSFRQLNVGQINNRVEITSGDDLTSIINSASAGTAFVLENGVTFEITSIPNLPNNGILYFNGATVKIADGANLARVFEYNGENQWYRGPGTIDANAANQTSAPHGIARAVGSPTRAETLEVINMDIVNVANTCIDAINFDALAVRDCELVGDSTELARSILAENDDSATGNRVIAVNNYVANSSGDAITINGGSGVSNSFPGSVVAGNILEDFSQDGGGVGIVLLNAPGSVISNNTGIGNGNSQRFISAGRDDATGTRIVGNVALGMTGSNKVIQIDEMADGLVALNHVEGDIDDTAYFELGTNSPRARWVGNTATQTGTAAGTGFDIGTTTQEFALNHAEGFSTNYNVPDGVPFNGLAQEASGGAPTAANYPVGTVVEDTNNAGDLYLLARDGSFIQFNT